MKRAFSFLSSVIEMKIPFLVVMAAKKLSACGALQAVQTERWHLGPWVAFQRDLVTAGMLSSEMGKVGQSMETKGQRHLVNLGRVQRRCPA